MRENFIEELFYGNIDPQARGFRRGYASAEPAGESADEIEEKLTGLLQGEEKKLFLRFCNAHAEQMGDASLEAFTAGFRLGARFMLDTFLSEYVE